MAISKDIEAAILRYHHVEKWRITTIATQLGIHHSTVDRVLSQAGFPKAERATRASMIDPYLPFIVETLRQFPRLSAARLYHMAKERGYPGSDSHFRHRVAELRPRPPAQAYLRLTTLPGEQSQVDWAHCGSIQIGRAKHPLMAFVMVLSWSRQIFVQFYLNQRLENFLRGHEAAFVAWKGVPRVCLYDNLRSAVLERRGEAIRFNPVLLEFSGHYRFEARPVAPYRPTQKGRVERAISFIRKNFLAARQWRDIEDLNAQALAWCWGDSAQRRCPQQDGLTVGEAFEQERPRLITLPDNPFPTDERVEVSVGKTPYARFDGNDYSVPHTSVRRTLTVSASLSQVRILNGSEVIAKHRRSYSKGEQIEDPQHIEKLIRYKRHARTHCAQDRLSHAAPASEALLTQTAKRGKSVKTAVTALLQLLDEYGGSELNAAIVEALRFNAPNPTAVRLTLERRREQRQLPPPLPIPLPQHHKARDLAVRPPSLKAYEYFKTGPSPELSENLSKDTDTHGDSKS